MIVTKSLRLLAQRFIGIFYYKNRAQHHCTCVPLKTAIASFSIGMNLWVEIVVVGKDLY